MFLESDPTATEAWTLKTPDLAFENDALLYSLFSISALHMAEAEAQRSEALDLHRRYLGMALREHNNDVANINQHNFDAICLASSLLRMIGFAMLRDRPLVPYTVPSHWLDMTRGTLHMFHASWDWIAKDDNSMAARLTKRMPLVFDEEAKFAESNRQDFLHLLRRDEEDLPEEAWDPDIEEAYKKTTSYIGCIWIAMKNAEPPAQVSRRIIMFPYLVPGRFIDLVKGQQPRALAVLAHYFALLTKYKRPWFIGNAGSREFHALNAVLTGKWQELLAWPLRFMEAESSPR